MRLNMQTPMVSPPPPQKHRKKQYLTGLPLHDCFRIPKEDGGGGAIIEKTGPKQGVYVGGVETEYLGTTIRFPQPSRFPVEPVPRPAA